MKATSNTLEIVMGTACTGDGSHGSKHWPIVEDFLGDVRVEIEPETPALAVLLLCAEELDCLLDAAVEDAFDGVTVIRWHHRQDGQELVCEPAEWEYAPRGPTHSSWTPT